jgi:hypothetical protein
MTGQRKKQADVNPSAPEPVGSDEPIAAAALATSGQGTEHAAADPGGTRPGEPGAAAAAGRVRALLEEMFGRIAPIGAAFAGQRSAFLAAGTELAPDRLSRVKEIIWRQLGLLPAADGAGVVAAPGVVSGRERHLEWWQRSAAGDGSADAYSRIRLNLDPESIDLYDYLVMDWFTVPQAEGRRYVYGPFIDFSGADRSILAMTIPIFAPVGGNGGNGEAGRADGESNGRSRYGEFLGVAGADIRMSQLEPALLAILRPLACPAVLATAERRVIAANTARWIVGTRLDRLPRLGYDGFTDVAEIGADSGWLLAAARR